MRTTSASSPSAASRLPAKLNRARPGRSERATAADTFERGAARAAAPRVFVDDDGRLGPGRAPHTVAEEIRAMAEVVAGAARHQPLADVGSKKLLQRVADRAETVFERALKTPKGRREAREHVEQRSAALGVLEAAARRAGAMGGKALQDELTARLLKAVAREPDVLARDFAYECALDGEKELGDLTAVREALYPSRFDRARMLKDGKIKLLFYLDNDSVRPKPLVEFLTSIGFAARRHADGTQTLTRAGNSGDPPLEIELQKKPEDYDERASQPILSRLGEEDVDGVIYTGHSFYSFLGESALEQAKGTDAAGKPVVLLSCDADALIGLFRRHLPHAHLFGTRGATEDVTDNPFLDCFFTALQKGQDYRTFKRAVVRAAEPAFQGNPLYEGFDVSKHYFDPADREVIRSKVDVNEDGRLDKAGPVFDVVTPRHARRSSYSALRDAPQVDGLSGALLTRGTDLMNLCVREIDLPDGARAAVKWNDNLFEPAGLFAPKADDVSAFRFEKNPNGSRVRVKLSTRFAHASLPAMSRMLAWEGGQWLARASGASGELRAATALSFLARTVYQYSAPTWIDRRETADEHEARFLERYGLATSFKEIARYAQENDYLDPRDFRRVLRWVRSRPDLTQAVDRPPRRLEDRGGALPGFTGP